MAGVFNLRHSRSGDAGRRSAGARVSAGGGRRRHREGRQERSRFARAGTDAGGRNRNWARPKCSCRRRGSRAFPAGTGSARRSPIRRGNIRTALAWGDDTAVENLFADNAKRRRPARNRSPISLSSRKIATRRWPHLRHSSLSVVQELLRTRSLNKTVLLPPSSSASGQAFDAALWHLWPVAG